ncbi:ribonuclease H-like domain-containing protein [Tanacetum coccineum]
MTGADTTNDLLTKLLQQLGNLGINNLNNSVSSANEGFLNTATTNPWPVAFHIGPMYSSDPSYSIGPQHAQFVYPSFSSVVYASPSATNQPVIQPGDRSYLGSSNYFTSCFQCRDSSGSYQWCLEYGYSTGDLYPITTPFPILRPFLVSQHTWHQRLGHSGGDVLHRLVSNNVISCNKEKPPVLCLACQLGKHMRLPFVSSRTAVTSCFDIIHSDSYRDAFHDSNWQNAMRDEYNALIKNQTWTLVPRPPVPNIVRCMWFFFHKYLADGILSRYKARLVANGSTQLEGVDVDDTFSPVVKPGTIRTVLSLAVSRHWPIHQLDVKNAFLHGDLSETVYMHQPPGFRDSTYLDHVCLHGMDTDYLLLYVDDIVLTASSQPLLQRIIASLHQEFSMTNLGSLNYFLGIFVTRDSSRIFLSQRKYVVEILKNAHMVNCNSSRTPVDTESNLGANGDPISDLTLYRSLAGSLQYLTFTRPNISYAVQQVCLYMHDPREPHFLALKQILQQVVLLLGDRHPATVYLLAKTYSLGSLRVNRRFLVPVSRPSIVVLSMLAIYLSCNPVQHQRTKHIEIEIHFVRDLVDVGQVRMLHVPSRYQFADIFTKELPSTLFEEFRSSLSVRCPPAPTAEEC